MVKIASRTSSGHLAVKSHTSHNFIEKNQSQQCKQFEDLELSTYTYDNDYDNLLHRYGNRRVDGSRTDTGVQARRSLPAERFLLSTPLFISFRHILALIIPIVNTITAIRWNCPPSDIIRASETIYINFEGIYDRIWCHFLRIAEGPLARELYAMTIDAILLIYAIGFLLLSMYEVAIIGR